MDINENLHKLAFGEMTDPKNVFEVVKQLYFICGQYHNFISEARKVNPFMADMCDQQFLKPAMSALNPYMPWIVRTYPQNFDEETRKKFGAN